MKVAAGVAVALVLLWWLSRSGAIRAAGGLGAVLYLVSVDASFNAYSSINSSPWTYENMSGDSGKASSGSKYVWTANAVALVLGAFASVIARSLWPLGGAATVVAIMHLLYRHAMSTGKREGNTDWGGSSSSSSNGGLQLVGP